MNAAPLSLKAKVVLIIVHGMVVLACLELFLRFTSPERTLSLAQRLVTADSRGDTIHVPNLSIDAFSNEQGNVIHIETNAEGYVGHDYPIQKTTGTIRAAVAGDSYVAALQTDTDKNFVSLLEQDLNQQHIPADVMNFGVGGQGTMEEMLRYHYYIQKYHPDYLFVFFFPNDFENNQYYLDQRTRILNGTDDWYSTPLSHANNNHGRTDLKYRLIQNSYLVRAVDDLIRKNTFLSRLTVLVGLHTQGIVGPQAEDGIEPGLRIYETPLPATYRTLYVFTSELLQVLQRQTQRDGVKLVVVYLPEAIQVDQTLWKEKQAQTPALGQHQWDMNQPNRFLRDETRKNAISFLDLSETFIPYYTSHPSSTLYNGREGHMNTEGHQIIANALQAFILTDVKNAKKTHK